MDPLWPQNYDPLNSPVLSTLLAALPVVVLLGSIALLRIRIHFSALIGLGTALAIALAVYHMPAKAAGAATLYGAAFGLFPIGSRFPTLQPPPPAVDAEPARRRLADP